MIGKIIKERYKIYDKVGSGGVATVYIARDLQTYEVVALKILKTEYTDNTNYVKRFLREAEVVSSLHHHNITSVKDYGIEENLHFIVMEYVEGKMLSQIVEEKGALSYEEGINVITQVLSALQYAWENGIVAHRDIKPQNIMMDKNGLIKVMDFGIARVSTSHTMTQAGTFMGTPYYMSPEQAQGKETDIRSDIYSIGITLFQLITGKVPFDADTPWSVVNMHITQAPPMLQIPQPFHQLAYVINKSLAKQIEDRYQTPQEMLIDLQMLSQGSMQNTMTNTSSNGELSVHTTPPGARVFVQNELKGVSPTIVKNLPPKSLRIRIEKEGFRNEEKNCTIVSNQRALLNVQLKPSSKITNTMNSTVMPTATYSQNTIIQPSASTQIQPPSPMYQSAPKSNKLMPLWISLSVLFALVLIGLGIVLWQNYSPFVSKNPFDQNNQISNGGAAIASGSISINSEPPGAEIYLNGKSLQQKTPYTLTSLSPGNYELTVILGSNKATESIKLEEGESRSIMIPLSASSTNSLEISSDPSGASVWINQKDTGKKTPTTIEGLNSGIHEIELRLAGFENFSAQINVSGKTPFSAKLVPSRDDFGTVQITSTPTSSLVYINKQSYGLTPQSIKLPPGTYELVIEKDGYNRFTQSFTLSANQNLTIQANLVAKPSSTPPPPSPKPPPAPKPDPTPPPSVPSTGTLWVLSQPDGAEVFVNGTFRGVTPLRLENVSAGTYSIKIHKEGYEDQTKSATVTKGQLSKIEFTLKRKAAGNATLVINTQPQGAEIYINGQLVGLSSANSRFTIAEGTHTLLIRLEGYQDYSISITVKASEVRELNITLQKK